MRSLRMRSRIARGTIIGGLLKLIGLVVVGLIGLAVLAAMLEKRPTPAPQPMPVAVAPGPVAQPGPVTPIAPAPVPNIKFGLTEEKRAEISCCLWQGGIWAGDEIERQPQLAMDRAPRDNHEARERLIEQRNDFYMGRLAIRERLVAKKYGLPVETIRAIEAEWFDKPFDLRFTGMWKPSAMPVLFDRDEANRAVAKHSMVPLTPEEKTLEERQRLIDRRKAKREERAKQRP